MIPFETGDNILDYSLKQAGSKTAWKNECKHAKEECEDLQKQRRAVEGEVQEHLWNTSTVYFALGARTEPGVKPLWTESQDGKQRL